MIKAEAIDRLVKLMYQTEDVDTKQALAIAIRELRGE